MARWKPRLTVRCTTSSSSAKVAFRYSNSPSARTAARPTTTSSLTGTPSRVTRPTASSRSNTDASTSTATKPCGAVCDDAIMCWPIRRRPCDSGTTTSSVGPLATARSASRRVIDPPGPEPRTAPGSTPASARIRRTTGDTTTPLTSLGVGKGGGAGSTWRALGAVGEGGAGSAPVGVAFEVAPSLITATREPVSTVSPSAARISARTPEAGDGISESTLSVETSKRGSSRLTWSPTFLNHRVMIPSVTDSPSEGSVTSVMASTLPAQDSSRLLVNRAPSAHLYARGNAAL